MVNSAFLCSLLCSFFIMPISLQALVIFSFIWALKSSFSSKWIPKCFWLAERSTIVSLKKTDGWQSFTLFLEKITSWACFLGSGLNDVFHWWAQLEIFSKSLFNWSADRLTFFTVEKIDVSSAKSLVLEERLFDKSFM